MIPFAEVSSTEPKTANPNKRSARRTTAQHIGNTKLWPSNAGNAKPPGRSKLLIMASRPGEKEDVEGAGWLLLRPLLLGCWVLCWLLGSPLVPGLGGWAAACAGKPAESSGEKKTSATWGRVLQVF